MSRRKTASASHTHPKNKFVVLAALGKALAVCKEATVLVRPRGVRLSASNQFSKKEPVLENFHGVKPVIEDGQRTEDGHYILLATEREEDRIVEVTIISPELSTKAHFAYDLLVTERLELRGDVLLGGAVIHGDKIDEYELNIERCRVYPNLASTISAEIRGHRMKFRGKGIRFADLDEHMFVADASFTGGEIIEKTLALNLPLYERKIKPVERETEEGTSTDHDHNGLEIELVQNIYNGLTPIALELLANFEKMLDAAQKHFER